MSEKYKLSRRELEVIQALWSLGKGVTAAEIGNFSSLSIHTVQTVIKSLLKKNYISTEGIAYSGTVLARQFIPTFTAADYIKSNFSSFSNERMTLEIVSTLIQGDINKSSLQELEEILQKRRLELEED